MTTKLNILFETHAQKLFLTDLEITRESWSVLISPSGIYMERRHV